MIDGFFAADYGNPDPDPDSIQRGPSFTVQPVDTVHEPVVTEAVASDIATLECIADAVPEPSTSQTHVMWSVGGLGNSCLKISGDREVG